VALPLKERLFVANYLGISAGNATDAARRAGYKHPNVYGSRLLSKASVYEAIEVKLAEIVMPQNELLMRVSDIAAASIEDFVRVDGFGGFELDLKKAKRRGRFHVLKKLKETKDGPEIELKDSLAALIKLGGYYGLWDRVPTPEINMEEVARKMKAGRPKRERKKAE